MDVSLRKLLLVFLPFLFMVGLFGQTNKLESNNLMIVYDVNDESDLELHKLSQNFVTLISSKKDVRVSIFTKKEYDSNKVTSQQYCLFIGENCSSSLNFDDIYSDMGMHIGYIGKKAWIRCGSYDWTKTKFLTFETLLETYCKKYNMTQRYKDDYLNNDRIRILRQFKTGKESWVDKEYLEYESEDKLIDRLSGVGASLLIYGDPMIRKYQYLLATLMFYDKYINKFLKPKITASSTSLKSNKIAANNNARFVKSDFESFKQGVDYYISLSAGKSGSRINEGNAGKYLKDLHAQIEQFKKDVNSYQNNKNPNANGYLAEVWHKNTFNIDAVAKQTGEITAIPPTTFASADVQGNWGEQYQLKYCKDAWNSAKDQGITYNERFHIYNKSLEKQGKTSISIQEFLRDRGIDENINVNLPIYEAQARLIPSDQIENARTALKKAIDKELNNLSNPNRKDLVQRYQDVLSKLTDHIESPNGAKSLSLSLEESKVLQSLAREGNFNPEKFDITLAKRADYLCLTKSTLKSGLNSTIYDATFKILPDITASLSSLIINGKISQEQINQIASEGGQASAEGFLLGYCTALIENSSKIGVWGKEIQSLALSGNPNFNNVVVLMVTTTIETIKDAIKLQKGLIDKKEFMQRLDKRVFIASCGHIIGLVSQSVFFEAPVVAYMVGSFIGVVLGNFVFEVKEKAFMSICVEYGYTCFGLVEQNYELPVSVKKYIGMDYFDIDEMKIDTLAIDNLTIDKLKFDQFNFDKLDIKLVKRGVIGIRKVGYIESK